MKHNGEVLSVFTMYTSFKQVNPPSHPGQPSSLVAISILSPSLIGNCQKGNAGMFFIFLVTLYFHIVPTLGLANNQHLIMFIE